MKGSERIYRWLLSLYPRDFRDEYGDEMSLLFRERAHERLIRLWLQVLRDLLFHAPRKSTGARSNRTSDSPFDRFGAVPASPPS